MVTKRVTYLDSNRSLAFSSLVVSSFRVACEFGATG